MAELPDDAIEAAARAISGYSTTQYKRWRHTSRGQQHHDRAVAALAAAYPIIAARVRAEAVADERQRIVAEVGAPAFTRSLWAVLRGSITAGDSVESIAECVVEEICSLAAAGSVPVATPPAAQRTRQSEVRGTAHGTGVYAELEAARAPDPARRSPRRARIGKPETLVATPTEPVKCWCNGAPTVSHRRGTEGCRYAPDGDFAASPVPAVQPQPVTDFREVSDPNLTDAEREAFLAGLPTEQPEER